MAARLHDAATKMGGSAGRDAVYTKVSWRIMPILLLCYVANFIDRTNISIAQIHMRTDLDFTDEIYGIGVGLFFIGFIIFEVPSNILLERIGVRKTLLRIMVAWGLVSATTTFATTPLRFYCARILLGAAEAGFFPGVLLYLTYWYPSVRRGRMTSLFFLGLPLSGFIGSALSGWILHSFNNVFGLRGWQWMFLMEGVPSVLLGLAAFLFLADRPQDARWLSIEEKQIIRDDLAKEQAVKGHKGHYSFFDALRDPRVYVLGVVGIGTYTLANAVSFWTPLIISESGVKEILNIGFLAAFPPLVGAVSMLLVGRHSDLTLERRWHAACCEFSAVAALLLLSFFYKNPMVVVPLLAIMTAGHYSAVTVFWSVPSIYLSEKAAAGGIAIVTAMGSVAAALSPVMLGWIQKHTGRLSSGLQISAAIISISAIVLLIGVPARLLPERSNAEL